MNLNRAQLIGRLTRDPERKELSSGAVVANFSMATNNTYTDKSGAKQETAEFHNIVAFGNLANLAAQYLKKGQEAMVEGRITTRTWDKQDGTKGYRVEILASSIQFGARPQGTTRPTQQEQETEADLPNIQEDEIDIKDIPF